MNDPQLTLPGELMASLASGRGREVLERTVRRVHDHGKAAVMATRDQRVPDL